MCFDLPPRKVSIVTYYHIYFKTRGTTKWKKSNFPESGKSTDSGKVRKGSEGFYHESGAHYEYNPCNTVKYNRCQILVKRRAMDFQETKQSLLEYFFGHEPNISLNCAVLNSFSL